MEQEKNNEGKCEVFEQGRCTGCVGMEYDIDKLKLSCEKYKKYRFKMEDL